MDSATKDCQGFQLAGTATGHAEHGIGVGAGALAWRCWDWLDWLIAFTCRLQVPLVLQKLQDLLDVS